VHKKKTFESFGVSLEVLSKRREGSQQCIDPDESSERRAQRLETESVPEILSACIQQLQANRCVTTQGINTQPPSLMNV